MRSRTALRFSVFVALASLSPSPLLPNASAQEPTDTFTIAGDVCCLTPGVRHAIDVTLMNPNSYAVDVHRLTTQVASSPPGCDAMTNIRLTQSPVSPSNTVALAARGSTNLAGADRPEIELINLPVNQDVCKDETFVLTFAGTATAPDARVPGKAAVVAGVTVPPPSSGEGTSTLPRTGVYVGTFVLTGLVLMVGGGLLRKWSTLRRRTEGSR